jgi:hypothetical protein
MAKAPKQQEPENAALEPQPMPADERTDPAAPSVPTETKPAQTTDEVLTDMVIKLQQHVETLQDVVNAISASAAAAAQLNTELAGRVTHLERMLGVDASSAKGEG